MGYIPDIDRRAVHHHWHKYAPKLDEAVCQTDDRGQSLQQYLANLEFQDPRVGARLKQADPQILVQIAEDALYKAPQEREVRLGHGVEALCRYTLRFSRGSA